MRVLLIKMSSLGDVFHTFPALSDAMASVPGLKVDWVVEEGFAEIPSWHPVVDQVYPIRLRAWRKNPIRSRLEIQDFFSRVNQTNYDLVIDAQGLLKSVWVVRKIHAKSVGLSWRAVREPLASLSYDAKVFVDKDLHAIERIRLLFSKALMYDVSKLPLSYELNTTNWEKLTVVGQGDYKVFLHGTTWDTKLWPVENWIALTQNLLKKGQSVVLPWGTGEEQARAQLIKSKVEKQFDAPSESKVMVPDVQLSLNEVARLLKFASGVVSVDTGLSHVAAALDVPMVVLYRVTDPRKIGALGKNVRHLESPVASGYIKKFNSRSQEMKSLVNLSVEDVLHAMESL